MIKTIQVDLAPPTRVTYPIQISSGLLLSPTDWLPNTNQKLIIITDHCVKALYAKALQNKLREGGQETLLLSFPPGESSKAARTKSRLELAMLKNRCGRNSLVLAIGGGVVGDVAGFVAATYLRGVACMQIPTTLLAMVDSSVGGKTGVDTPYGKNLIGAFWQPKSVICDISCLQTLPQEHLINGLIEALKMFLTNDAESLSWLQTNLDAILRRDETLISELVQRAIRIKVHVIQLDEKEEHLRAVLNFGHTIGHALEQLHHYRILHGYAVAYGMLVEAKIAVLMGLLDENIYRLLKTILQRLEITTKALQATDIPTLIQHTKIDKKSCNGVVNYVLLTGLGQVHQPSNRFAHPVTDDVVMQAFIKTIKEPAHGW